jgi:adenylylsulfate kinase
MPRLPNRFSMGESNTTDHPRSVSILDRERRLGQRGCVVWLTGLSGSGKSTIARAVESALAERGILSFVLDGDILRHGLNSDLGFSAADREENVRRTGEVAALFADAAIIVLAALISPFRAGREQVRKTVGEERFLEVFVDTPLEACESRDPKGLYERARRGEIPEFTGISSPYETPERPALTIQTEQLEIGEATAQIMALLETRMLVTRSDDRA